MNTPHKGPHGEGTFADAGCPIIVSMATKEKVIERDATFAETRKVMFKPVVANKKRKIGEDNSADAGIRILKSDATNEQLTERCDHSGCNSVNFEGRNFKSDAAHKKRASVVAREHDFEPVETIRAFDPGEGTSAEARSRMFKSNEVFTVGRGVDLSVRIILLAGLFCTFLPNC